jgi:hypothetical protein
MNNGGQGMGQVVERLLHVRDLGSIPSTGTRKKEKKKGKKGI